MSGCKPPTVPTPPMLSGDQVVYTDFAWNFGSHKISRPASSGSKPKLNKYSSELTQNKVRIVS